MPPTINAKDFITLLQAKLLETQVEMSVLRQEYADKFGQLESKIGMILQATVQYEESSQSNSTLCMTFDGDMQPLVKSLKFESELKFKIHLNKILETSVLDQKLEVFFPQWTKIRKLIQRAIVCKSKSDDDDDDDFLEKTSEDESDRSCPEGVIKFSSMAEEDEWKVYLLDTLYGVRKARTRRELGYRNIPKTKKETVEDDDDEEVDESSDDEEEEDGEQKIDSAYEEKEGDGEKKLSTKEGVKIIEIDLTDHQFRGQLLRFIDKVWTFVDFDVFGTGQFQTVLGMKPSGVQFIFADCIHKYLTEDQKTVKFLREVHHHSNDGPLSEINLLTAEGWLP